jgi:hypothetical protein
MPQLPAPDLAKPTPNLAKGRKPPEADGVCYLRLWPTVKERDDSGLLVDSLRVRVEP